MTPLGHLRVLVLALLAALVAALVHGPAASADAIPDAEIRIQGQAYEGPRGTILGEVRVRCAPDLVATSFVLQISQGAVATPPSQEALPSCTGDLESQSFSSLEAFDPGPATVVATLELADAVTGEPRGTVTQTRQIYVRPAAKILLPRKARLLPGRVVKLVVHARCDEPWVPGDFIVSATQGEPVGAAHDTEFVTVEECDGDYRSYVVLLDSERSPDRGVFRTGWIRVDAELTVFDPEFFDPVAQARKSRAVRVYR
jgi:hypothetical protein